MKYKNKCCLINKPCEHLKRQYRNYGFVSGTFDFCMHPKLKCRIDGIIERECPLDRKESNNE